MCTVLKMSHFVGDHFAGSNKNSVVEERCEQGWVGLYLRVLHVSLVFTMDNLENDKCKHKRKFDPAELKQRKWWKGCSCNNNRIKAAFGFTEFVLSVRTLI